MSPKFSVVLPTFNRGHLLEHAVQSVLNQSFTNWDLWVIDDGSTDNTKDVVLAFNDDRIHYVYQENSERSVARNHGISLASGSYIAFLDSDDCYDKKFLEEVNRACGDQYVGMIACSVRLGLSRASKVIEPQPLNDGESTQEYVFKQPIGTPRMVIHRTLFEEYTFDPLLRFGEDRDLWVRMAHKHPIKLAPHALFVEIDHGERSINVDQDPWRTTKTLLSLKRRGLLINTRTSVYKQTLGKEYLASCRIALKGGNRKNALRAILLALYYSTKNWKFKLNVFLSLLLRKEANSILRLF